MLVIKNLPTNAGDLRDAGLIPGLGSSPGGGHHNPLQYSCLENPMDRGAWQAMVHKLTKSWTQLSDLACMHTAHLLFAEWMNKWMDNFLLPLLWGFFSLVSVSSLCLSLLDLSFQHTIFIILSLEKKDFSLVPRSSWGYWFFLIPPSFILYIHVL